jgi:transporter family-2 protein
MNIGLFYPILVFIAGAMTALQPLINAKLSNHVDAPVWASFISFAVGTVILLVVGLLISGKFTPIETQGMKWWMWTGGVLGAVFVTVAIYAVPHLGVSVLVALLIAGQLIFSAVLSHYGVLADAPRPMTLTKFSGICLLGVGALMVLKG